VSSEELRDAIQNFPWHSLPAVFLLDVVDAVGFIYPTQLQRAVFHQVTKERKKEFAFKKNKDTTTTSQLKDTISKPRRKRNFYDYSSDSDVPLTPKKRGKKQNKEDGPGSIKNGRSLTNVETLSGTRHATYDNVCL
jgi:hypothetical protein